MKEEFKPVVINGHPVPLCTVEYLDDTEKNGNVGYFYAFAAFPVATGLEQVNKIPLFVSIFMGHFEGKPLFPSVEAAAAIGSIIYEEGRASYIIAFPRRENESQQDAMKRMVNARKVITVDGKVIASLPQHYTKLAEYKEDWKKVLEGASFLRMAALYSDLPISTPQAITFTELFPAEVAPRSRNILYKKADGKLMAIPLAKLEEKIARSRGIEKFTFTNNILIPQMIADFLKRGTQKGTESNSQYPEHRFLGWEQDLAIGCQRNAGDRQQLTDKNIKTMSELCDRVEIRKVPGIGGFGLFAIMDFPGPGVFVGHYAGRFCDYMYPQQETKYHNYKTVEEDVAVWSINQAIYSFREGNLTGLINHAPVQKVKDNSAMQTANVLHQICVYNGLPVPCYLTLRPIKAGEQLLTCVPTIFADQPELFFNEKGDVIKNAGSKALAKICREKSVAFSEVNDNRHAKRNLKQAYDLEPTNDWTKYSLGLTYFKLSKETPSKKTKYEGHAVRFFELAKQSPKFQASAEKYLKHLGK